MSHSAIFQIVKFQNNKANLDLQNNITHSAHFAHGARLHSLCKCIPAHKAILSAHINEHENKSSAHLCHPFQTGHRCYYQNEAPPRPQLNTLAPRPSGATLAALAYPAVPFKINVRRA